MFLFKKMLASDSEVTLFSTNQKASIPGSSVEFSSGRELFYAMYRLDISLFKFLFPMVVLRRRPCIQMTKGGALMMSVFLYVIQETSSTREHWLLNP